MREERTTLVPRFHYVFNVEDANPSEARTAEGNTSPILCD